MKAYIKQWHIMYKLQFSGGMEFYYIFYTVYFYFPLVHRNTAIPKIGGGKKI